MDMFDRLEDTVNRYEDITAELGNPDVVNDQNRFRKLMEEQSSLAPLIATYTEYKNCKQTIEDSLQLLDEESDEECELCGRRMVIKYGPHGRFLACPGFPECRNTKPYFEKVGVPCPKCGKDIILKKTKKGRKYYGCIGNPECDFMVWQKPSKEKCPQCGSLMLEKGNKLVCYNEDCGYIMEKKSED